MRAGTLDVGNLAGMHDHQAAVALLDEIDHARVGEARHVVDDGGSHADGRLGDFHMAGIDRHNGAGFGERLHDRQHAARLGVGIDRGETGTGRLAADVDDIGAIVEHLEAVRDCGVGVEVLATVAEGIGRDVEDAHDARAVELQLVFSAAPNFGIACHEDPFETDKLVLLYPAHSFYVARMSWHAGIERPRTP